MAKIEAARYTAEIDGDFAVFLIGMRINKFWKVHKWWPVASAMGPMLAELERNPEFGLLHARAHFGLRNAMIVQYWRSFDHLHRYAKGEDLAHLPAWKAFNNAIAGDGKGDVGIWHETFLVRAGEHENIYVNMPPYGLGIAGRLVPAKGRKTTARGRLNLPQMRAAAAPGEPQSFEAAGSGDGEGHDDGRGG
jgi:hypothetical protein